MEIIPVAFDSMGVRSMATLVKSKISIFIDPGVALGPKRYGLPPHPIEIKEKEKYWNKVKKSVKDCDIVVITHYHYDHHNPKDVDRLTNKLLLVKHPSNKINLSQKKRAAFFLNQVKDICRVEFADSKSFEFDNVLIKFSKPVFHGTNSKLGYVLEILIEYKNKSFLYSSDVEGPSLEEQLGFMLESNAKTVFVDGPMTYMLGYRYSTSALESSIKNLIRLIENTDVKNLILDHHLARDLRWREHLSKVFSAGKDAGVNVCSAAEFAGKEERLLEAMRKELYAKYPV